jgi:hypothetical protein
MAARRVGASVQLAEGLGWQLHRAQYLYMLFTRRFRLPAAGTGQQTPDVIDGSRQGPPLTATCSLRLP